MSTTSGSSVTPEKTHDQTLPTMLRQAAFLRPDAAALIAEDQTLTFRELIGEAQSLANVITSSGTAPDSTVGIFAEPGLDLPVLIWATLFAGGAYLPLAPEYPDERLRYMIEHSNTRLILTEPHLEFRVREIAPEGTLVLTMRDSVVGDELLHASAPRPENLAYCIYTSGSTGRPKGVMIEHQSIVAQLEWLRGAGHLGPDTRILQKTPISFDAAQWEILAPAAGATVVMGLPESHRNPYALVGLIGRHSVTSLQGVPTLLQALLDTEGFETCVSLQRIYSGGEALSMPLARALQATLPWCSLTNLYGPTECTINVLAHTLSEDDDNTAGSSAPIGRPLPGVTCLVLDEELRSVNEGEAGNLYIGGVQVSRGYLNDHSKTSAAFIPSPLTGERLYRTGDVVRVNEQGNYHFLGRSDNQIKLRGYRVELEEIAAAVEHHPWVRQAAVVVANNARTGSPELVACIEMNPNEAALMDQGNHGGHHQSKASKLQVKAQLSDAGIRSSTHDLETTVIGLDGANPSARMRGDVFARKSYRYYEGGSTSKNELCLLLQRAPLIQALESRVFASLSSELGHALRWIGQFRSAERLLPKYAFASPGALYAVQTYLELIHVPGIPDGIYYYHPMNHELRLVHALASVPEQPEIKFHLVGKTSAIEPVYKNNVREVLEFEAGHLIGALQDGLAVSGKTIKPLRFDPRSMAQCQALTDDAYLGTFEVVEGHKNYLDAVDSYVNIPGNKISGVVPGTYAWSGVDLEFVSGDVVQRKHVIAINQRVFDRSSFGISAVAGVQPDWLKYITLGCYLHRAQRNGLEFCMGFMSSGYSSKSGNPLPASRRIADILHDLNAGDASYFFVGGKISSEQRRSEGMHEDLVHMQGPAEMVREELSQLLPDYMVPHRTVVFDRLPTTPNGKVDRRALSESPSVVSVQSTTSFIKPATATERRLAAEWGDLLKYEEVSTEDEFFAVGGNSLMSLTLINRISRIFNVQLPLRTLIDTPKLADLATLIDRQASGPSIATSRFIPLNSGTQPRPIFCWPGLGGYPMNLMKLAAAAIPQRTVYGVQSMGINPGETPYPTIQEMAKADITEILSLQSDGPFTLWGYSFGARVAFEIAWQLECLGKKVDQLMLICPGNPGTRGRPGTANGRSADFTDPAFLAVLCSVFTGASIGVEIERCLREVSDKTSFIKFMQGIRRELEIETIRRITDIVIETFEFEYTFSELIDRRITAPITIFKALGDDYSFIESAEMFSHEQPRVITLSEDHYAVLKDQGVDELARELYLATSDTHPLHPRPQVSQEEEKEEQYAAPHH